MLKLSDEMRLFKEHWRYFFFILPGIILIHNAAHNAVFWRWNQNKMYDMPPLPDLIMDNTNLKIDMAANGVRIGTLAMMAVTAIAALFFNSGHSSILIVRRFIAVYASASLLRCITFFATLLPATAPYCLSPTIGGTYYPKRAPHSFNEVFTRFDWTHACGDLLFSGHTALVVCMWLVIELIFAGAWGRFKVQKDNHQRKWIVMQMFAIYGARMKLVLFLYNTVKARKHYTIDVVVALYVTVLLWHVSGHYFATIDEEEETLPLSANDTISRAKRKLFND
jgi:hypothetical protein